MAGVNKVILIGNLGKDPQLDYTSQGTARCRFSIATSDQYTDRDGQRQERTEWHNVVLWSKLAEIAGEYLKKGRTVYIEGRIQTRQWQDDSGQTRYITEIVGNQMQMLGGGRSGGRGYDDAPPPDDPPGEVDQGGGSGGGARRSSGKQGGGPPQQDFAADDDDLPF